LIKHNFLIKLFLLIVFALPLFAGGAPYSYSYIPKVVYKNQLFPVTILVKHYNPQDPPRFEYDAISLIQPVNLKPVKVINKEEAFYTYYFKANTNDKHIEIPDLSIWNLDHSYTINSKDINLKDLKKKKKNYSGVLASKLRVNSTKVDTYDSSHNLVTLNLEANEANLEDMHIPNVIDDGIENLKRDGALTTATYYFIIPSEKKSINFSYFDTIKRDYRTKTVSLENQRSSLDTNNLKPKELDFEKLKKYILISLTLIFAIAYLLTRDWVYLLFFTLAMALLIYIFLPKKSICVNEGAALYILPTQNSNISLRIDKKLNTKVLKRYKNFNKIEYKNSLSGWIKNEDTCKN